MLKPNGSGYSWLAQLVLLPTLAAGLQAGPRTSANYNIATDTTDTGGKRATSASYTNDGSAGGIAGLSTVASPSETTKAGYVGQLFDVTGLVVNAGASSVNETATLQLGAWQFLDDTSVLAVPATSMTWGVVSGPITGISAAGIATAGVVYQNTPATVQRTSGGFTGTLNLTVLDSIADSRDKNTYSFTPMKTPTLWSAAVAAGLLLIGTAHAHDADQRADPFRSGERKSIFLAAIQRLLLACAVLTLLVIPSPAWAGVTWYDGVSLSRADYDYAPAVMYGDGPYIKMWWGGGTGSGDGIYYAELTGSGWTAPQLVLTKSTNGWDSYHVCDPSVIKGSFSYAGSTYAYALYYTGTYDAIGHDSHIGVAFSNDGKTWVKNTANPVVSPGANSLSGYGAGMQTVYRNTSTGLITLAYLDSSIPGSGGAHLFMVTSTDGKTFNGRTALPAPLPGGLDVATGDIAWDGSTGTWLVMTKVNNDTEIFIYRTANDELTSTWNTVGGISSTITGKVKNHNPGWLRLSNGDIYSEANTKSKYIYFGVGDGGDDGPSNWDIGQAEWVDSPVWVDFAFGGSPKHGTFANPFATLADGVSHVPSGGDIFLKGPQSGPGNITITKPMTLQAVGGRVIIGQ